MVGRVKMKDWRAAVRKWEGNNFNNNNNGNANRTTNAEGMAGVKGFGKL
jgi:hypothetical protein